MSPSRGGDQMIRDALSFLANDLGMSGVARFRFMDDRESFRSRGSRLKPYERISRMVSKCERPV